MSGFGSGYLAVGLLFLIEGCGVDGVGVMSEDPSPGPGVVGVVLVDTGCPVLEPGSSCPEVPVRAEISARQEPSGALVARTVSSADGRFRLDLAPGTYELRGRSADGAAVPTMRPLSITVRPDEQLEVTLHMDSGVRGPF